jgi:hypothetical protein
MLGCVVLVGFGVSVLQATLPVDGAGGNLRSFGPRGYRIDWIVEPRDGLLQVGDVVVRADGHTLEEWLRGAPVSSRWRADGVVMYEIERDGRTSIVPVRLATAPFSTAMARAWPQLLVGLLLLGIGLFAFWKRPRELGAQLLLLAGSAAALHIWRDAYDFQLALVARPWLF